MNTDRISTLERALKNIRELNLTDADEHGCRWARSDLIEQEIVFALVESREAGTVEPVASVVPSHCTGAMMVFDGFALRVTKDGSGSILVKEGDFSLEDDRCEGPDGPEGSVHWVARIAASEMTDLRDWLNGHPPASPTAQEAAKVLLADPAALLTLARAYDREDSAQRGEADPHDAGLFPIDSNWSADRVACATAALRAIGGNA